MLSTEKLTTLLTKYKIDIEQYNDWKNLLQQQFSIDQIDKLILRRCSKNTVESVFKYSNELLHKFTAEQIVKVAAHSGGSKNLEAVQRTQATLTALGFSAEQIIKIAAHIGGSKNLEAVQTAQATLTALGFTAKQIVKIAAHSGGSKNLEAVQRTQATLTALGFSAKQIIKLAAHDGGSKNLEAVQKVQAALTILGFTAEQIVKIAAHHGGTKNLEAVQTAQVALTALGFTAKQIVKMAAHNGGSKNLEAVQRAQATLTALGFSAEQIVKIAAHHGGSKNLEIITNHSYVINILALNIEEIVNAIIHGKTGRETLKKEIIDKNKGKNEEISLNWLDEISFSSIDLEADISNEIYLPPPLLTEPSFNLESMDEKLNSPSETSDQSILIPSAISSVEPRQVNNKRKCAALKNQDSYCSFDYSNSEIESDEDFKLTKASVSYYKNYMMFGSLNKKNTPMEGSLEFETRAVKKSSS